MHGRPLYVIFGILGILVALQSFVTYEPTSVNIAPTFKADNISLVDQDFTSEGLIQAHTLNGYTKDNPSVWCRTQEAIGLSWVPAKDSFVWTSYFPNQGDYLVFRPYVGEGYSSIWLSQNSECTLYFLKVIYWRLSYDGYNYPLDR